MLPGAPITDLATISRWAAGLLEAYHATTRLGALRFATTTGLEQTANSSYHNGSFQGIRVLSREYYGGGSSNEGACLKEYMKDATTPSTAVGFSPDNCNYDPR